MRLTLRTLLAYRDGVLSPQDHQDLDRRIHENAPVASLLQQINDLVRINEIRSPKLEVSGLGDANIVAEYLDDELSSEKVAELERLCLQNADHLCELAHCHQLLAVALNTHVNVPESLQEMAVSLMHLKQREATRRRLLTRSKSKAGQGGGDGDSSQQVASTPGKQRLMAGSQSGQDVASNIKSPLMETGSVAIRQTGLDLESSPLASEVPAYLLASQRKRWQIPAVIISLTAVLVFLIWQSVGSLDSIRSLWHIASSQRPQVELPEQGKSQQPVQDSIPDTNESSEGSSSNIAPPSELSELAASSDSSVSPSVLETAERPDKQADPPSSLAEPEVESDVQTATADSALPSAPPSEPPTVPLIGLTFSQSSTDQGKAVVFVAENGGQLQLLSERPPLASGRVIVPPSVRTSLQLGSWSWVTGGATTAEIDFTTSSTDSGKAVELTSQLFRGIFTSSDTIQELTLKTPLGSYRLKMLAPSVWLAVEIASRPMVRGSLTQAGTYAPALIIVAGVDGNDAPQELAQVVSIETEQRFVFRGAAQGLAVIGSQAPTEFSLQNPPRWYSKRAIRLIDQEACQDFFVALRDRQNSISEQIGQLTKHERPELAALAIQSSILLGNWRPLVSELLVADRLRAHWTSTLELARQLAIGNGTAQATLQELLKEDFGADAPRLFELFEGLSQPRQEASGLTELLKGLESESLTIRVLSSFELTQLTGKDHGFLPHAPVKATIQQIRRQLNTGNLAVLPIPDPIWERTPQL